MSPCQVAASLSAPVHSSIVGTPPLIIHCTSWVASWPSIPSSGLGVNPLGEANKRICFTGNYGGWISDMFLKISNKNPCKKSQRQRDHRAVYHQGHEGKKNDLSCTDVVSHKLLLVNHLRSPFSDGFSHLLWGNGFPKKEENIQTCGKGWKHWDWPWRATKKWRSNP